MQRAHVSKDIIKDTLYRMNESIPRIYTTEDIPSCRDKKENYGPQKRTGSATDFPSIIPANSNCGEYSERFDRPVTESVTARAADTEEILVMNVSTVATEQSELREMVLCETDKRGILVNREELTPERRRPENILPGTLRQVKMRNNQWNCVDYCFGVCGKADNVNRPGDMLLLELLLFDNLELSCFMFGGYCHQRPVLRD